MPSSVDTRKGLPLLAQRSSEPCVRLGKTSFDEFDTRTASPEELMRAEGLKRQMTRLGFNLDGMSAMTEQIKNLPNTPDRREGIRLFVDHIHDAATLLYLQFGHSRSTKDAVTQFASARLFNKLTRAAREIDEQHNLFDKSPIKEGLHKAIEQDIRREQANRVDDPSYQYDPRGIAEAMTTAAAARRHEDSWAWVMLPTYPKQHYGRILLDIIKGEDGREVFVTQPTFVDGQATLFHTHGKNWAWSLPLGEPGSGENRHINTLWEPRSRDQLFPLKQMDVLRSGKAYYSAGDVAVIPPKTIHGIAGSRLESVGKSLDEVESLTDRQRQALIAGTRIGEKSALHIYRADAALDGEFRSDPVSLVPGASEHGFFSGERNDMIVLDHYERIAWAGGGGAWDLRLKEHGPTGDHCGKCFGEQDPREAVPDRVVLDRFIDRDSPGLIFYPAGKLAGARTH